MKRLKKVGISSILLLYLALSYMSIFIMLPGEAAAAPAGDGPKELQRWQTTQGSIVPADVPNDRFIFNSPKSVTDRVTGAVYTTSATDGEMFASGTQEVLARGWFWYWPEGQELKQKSNGECYGAIAVSVYAGAGTGNGTRALSVELVQPLARADGETCTVPGTGDNGTNAVGKGGDPENQYEYDITFNMSEGSKVLLVTPLRWVDSGTIAVSNTDRVFIKADSGYVEKIRGYINDDGEDRKRTYAGSGYSYFYEERCLGDDDELSGFIAVSNSGKNRAAVFHRRGSDLNFEWDGQQQQCLFGRNIPQGPRLMIGGDSKNAVIGVYDVSKAEAEAGSGDTDEDNLGNTEADAGTPDCEGGGLSFVICPLVEGLASLADGIVETFLQPILRAEILDLPGSSNAESEALYNVWKSFRNIANALLILAFLAIIISTAVSSE